MAGVSRRPNACFVVLYGAELGKRYPLGRATFEIGRSSKNDLPLDGDAVSRVHARIVFEKGRGHVLFDLDSTNGTWVNDARVQEVELTDGDTVKVGRTLLKYMNGADLEADYNEEIYRIMTADALTGAYNERYVLEALEREFTRARRHERELSVVLFRVDGFKRIVDARGVVAGDTLLRLVAMAVQPRLRREDVMARLRDDRFAVLLPEVGREGALVAADKIRQIVQRTAFVLEDAPVACSVSTGVATFEKAHAGPKELLAAARAALRAARDGAAG